MLNFCKIITTYFTLFLFSVKSGEFGDCSWTFVDNNEISVTYDLSDFVFDDKSFEVFDSDYLARQYIYLFNICGSIPNKVWNSDSIVSSCYNSSHNRPCINYNSTSGDCIEFYNTTGHIPAAVQMEDYNNTNSNRCWWLGIDTNASDYDYNVSLYDEYDSSKGMVYMFDDGVYSSNHKTNRKLKVEFICPDSVSYYFDPADEIDIDESVVEYPPTVYTLSIKTPLACPAQCIAKYETQYAVCSGKGVCATDPNKKKVRCLCDTGYGGDLCSEVDNDTVTVTSTSSQLITALVMCIIILAIVVFLSAYLCHRIRLYKREGTIDNVQSDYFEPILFDSNTKNNGISMNINTNTDADANANANVNADANANANKEINEPVISPPKEAL